LIEWSEEALSSSAVCRRCHGATEVEVAAQLAAIVADLAEDVFDGKMPAPKPPPARAYRGKFLARVSPDLHRRRSSKPKPGVKASTSSWLLSAGPSVGVVHEQLFQQQTTGVKRPDVRSVIKLK
jgi:hypothetical protein